MESNRDKYTIKKLLVNKKGASLFAAILIALFALFALSGLYFAITKLLSHSQTIKTYTSLRDAAAGGVNHAVMLIEGKVINDNTYCSNNNPLVLNFRLSETSGVYENRINICISDNKTNPLGVAYRRDIGEDYIYTIISEVEGPQNTRSRIEAVYAR